MDKKNIIELRQVNKSYDGKTNVVENINLEIKEGEFVTILGPSGCGKTTILRMIGGFEVHNSGEIILDGKDISVLPPNKRPINTVFQKYALFPHLNVYDNIAFGLKLNKVSKDEMDQKVKKVLEIVDLEGFEKRSVNSLSGGQQQRIAIARAIVNQPRVLLLDEPLSALDYKMRKEMQLELKNMHKLLGITFIFVTHDQEEALTMSDKVVVMSDGAIQQVGTPEEIYNEPANVFVADFIGESNIFNGMMEEDKKATFAGRVFQTVDDYPKGTKIDAVIRPEDIEIVKPSEGQLSGKVVSVDFKGTFYVMFVECGQYEFEIHCFDHYEEGSEIGIKIDPDMIHIIKYDDSINRYIGQIQSVEGDSVSVKFEDFTKKIKLKNILPEASVRDGAIVDGQGNSIDMSDVSVEAYFEPENAVMSDNLETGLIKGTIISFYYIGDHYSYTIRTDSEVDYVANDPDLYNQGDIVSVSVDDDKIQYSIVK